MLEFLSTNLALRLAEAESICFNAGSVPIGLSGDYDDNDDTLIWLMVHWK